MSENNNHDLQSLMQWVQNQINRNPYSEISLRFCVHDGKVKRVERTLLEKLK